MWHDVGVQNGVRNQEWKGTTTDKGDLKLRRDSSNAEYNSVALYQSYLYNDRLNNSHYM